MTTPKTATAIEASSTLPTITITREFDAPPAKVFAAFTDADLYAQWIGPHSISTRIDAWSAVTGGAYRWTNVRDGEEIATFYGSFHEVRPNERIVQTQTFAPFPDDVTVETMTFEELEGGRTRIVGVSLASSFETRDMILSSGMETGVEEGYEKLDRILASS